MWKRVCLLTRGSGPLVIAPPAPETVRGILGSSEERLGRYVGDGRGCEVVRVRVRGVGRLFGNVCTRVSVNMGKEDQGFRLKTSKESRGNS